MAAYSSCLRSSQSSWISLIETFSTHFDLRLIGMEMHSRTFVWQQTLLDYYSCFWFVVIWERRALHRMFWASIPEMERQFQQFNALITVNRSFVVPLASTFVGQNVWPHHTHSARRNSKRVAYRNLLNLLISFLVYASAATHQKVNISNSEGHSCINAWHSSLWFKLMRNSN